MPPILENKTTSFYGKWSQKYPSYSTNTLFASKIFLY